MSLLNGLKSRVLGTAPRLKKRDFDPEKMTVDDITLPRGVKFLEVELARSFISQYVDTYKALGYVDMPLDQLKFPEYNSYEVGVVLRYLKENRHFLIANIDKILPSVILYSTKKQMHIKVFDMIFRYNEVVDDEFLKDDLTRDKSWSPMEFGYLLRYLSEENRELKKKK